MCWQLILILLVPAVTTSVGISSLAMLATGNRTLHKYWVVASVALFVTTCYMFARNDAHTIEDRERSPLQILLEVVAGPDAGFGSGLELSLLLGGCVALAYAPVSDGAAAGATFGLLALYVLEWSRRNPPPGGLGRENPPRGRPAWGEMPPTTAFHN